MCEPDTAKDLKQLLHWLQETRTKHVLIGAGSNLLFADEGFDGVVIRLGAGFASIQCEGTKLRAGAALSATKLARTAQDAGLSGLEFAAGIPASLGGMLAMNAGAYGQEISDALTRLQVMQSDGTCKWIDRSDVTPS